MVDELSYLSKKYSNYSFVAANYSKGMQYGSNSTTNVVIAPQFLSKMANDAELEKEYEENIAAMWKLDEEFAAQQASIDWRVEQGWAIDKYGGISKWIIGHKDLDAKRQADQEKKKKMQEELEEAGKEQFGDKWKGVVVINKIRLFPKMIRIT